MKFQFRYEYTLEDMTLLSRVSEKAYRHKKVLLTRLGVGALGIGYLLLGMVMLKRQSWVTTGIVALAGIFFLALAVFYHRITAWRAKRSMMQGMGELTVELEEDGLRGYSEKGDGFYPYDAFIGVFHSQGRYFLFADQRHAVLLPERAMTKGDSTTLRGFLMEKLGKKFRN